MAVWACISVYLRVKPWPCTIGREGARSKEGHWTRVREGETKREREREREKARIECTLNPKPSALSPERLLLCLAALLGVTQVADVVDPKQ